MLFCSYGDSRGNPSRLGRWRVSQPPPTAPPGCFVLGLLPRNFGQRGSRLRNFTEEIMGEEAEKESICWGRIQIVHSRLLESGVGGRFTTALKPAC
jgi:hypothetical protein